MESLRELQAEEAFRLAEVVSVGAAKMDKAGQDRTTRRWRSELGANGDGHRVQSAGELRAAARMMGIGVKTVEPR